MTYNTTETIQRLWATFLRDQLGAMPPEERQQYEQQLEDRFGELLKGPPTVPVVPIVSSI
ncbi:MAG UNVERIFIED_CONTAM: hypothetical protein LVR29_24995 [Microcystis novacekii LVE1205-3]|jgi:hypothetical protein